MTATNKEIDAFFVTMDIDGNGVLVADELKATLKKIQVTPRPLPQPSR